MQTDETLREDNSGSQALIAVQNTGGKLAKLPDLAVLEKQLEQMAQYRKLINEYIKSRFARDTHYYQFHFLKDCRIYRCRDSKHLSQKWEITAEGAKMMLGDFQLFPDFKPDIGTREMFADREGLVCLICFIYTIDGKFFASGRGNCRVGPYSDENRTTKVAQKRALIDALKSSGLLADFERVIIEKEGLLNGAQTLKTNSPVGGGCEFCFSRGKYHAKTCPLFGKAEIQNLIEPEGFSEEGEIVPDINMDEIPL